MWTTDYYGWHDPSQDDWGSWYDQAYYSDQSAAIAPSVAKSNLIETAGMMIDP